MKKQQPVTHIHAHAHCRHRKGELESGRAYEIDVAIRGEDAITLINERLATSVTAEEAAAINKAADAAAKEATKAA